jgi:hypothetical protein
VRVLRITWFVAIIWVSVLSCSISAQKILFDVKTMMQEKEALHVIKVAVINALDNSKWAGTIEVGENYSLWLTNARRETVGDSMISAIDFDLRTPAMFTRGKHILSKHVEVAFNTQGLSNEPTIDTVAMIFLNKAVEKMQIIGSITESFTTAGLSPLSFLIRPFVTGVIKELSRKPSMLETVESNLLAAQAVIVLKNTMLELQRSK